MSNTQPSSKKTIQIIPIQKKLSEQIVISSEEQLQSELDQLKVAQDELELVKKQREDLIANTEHEIQSAKEAWQQEKLELMEQARQEGFQAGFEQGKVESLEQYHHLIDQANGIIEASKLDYQSTVEKSEETILTLAVHVAQKIIKQEIDKEPELFLPIVKDAISTIKDQREVTIYLHPENYEYILSQKNELEKILESKAVLSIYINEALEVGSCMIEHPFGKIDARIHTQLSKIYEILQEVLLEQKA
ncbi:flagellar assembly protein FliH [Ornithinibacillus sp. FSL M8-0202]|uniref:flagellar assembly protein FliH n=1 Tax=Ornithinibacillus sp. FSL M8-0202 TaxID=2921616 RepID=UPI0030CC09DB